jgi:hypothetical protein
VISLRKTKFYYRLQDEFHSNGDEIWIIKEKLNNLTISDKINLLVQVDANMVTHVEQASWLRLLVPTHPCCEEQ